MTPARHVFPAQQLESFARRVFEFHGVPGPDAERASRILNAADLRGVDSHGIARLKRYSALLEAGTVNPKPDIRIIRRSPTTATVDGDAGLGLVVGPWANQLAMDMAEKKGAGWVAVRNSNHFGIAGYYPLQAVERNMIGWAMTNAGNLVAPFRGADRMLGTNPIALAFPGEQEPPVVVDMSTSAVAYGKIQMARRRGASIPLGWAIDRDGQATTDPSDIFDGGALLPLGSDEDGQGHKGYCLGSMVDILCGVLSGAGWGPFAPHFAMHTASAVASRGKGTGHFFGALLIEGFMDPSTFRRRMDDWIRTIRATPPAPGIDGPLIPGDPERLAEQERRIEGIPLLDSIVEDLRNVSQRTGVDLYG